MRVSRSSIFSSCSPTRANNALASDAADDDDARDAEQDDAHDDDDVVAAAAAERNELRVMLFDIFVCVDVTPTITLFVTRVCVGFSLYSPKRMLRNDKRVAASLTNKKAHTT